MTLQVFENLVVLALEAEAPNLVANYRNVFVVGVGKVQSAINTMRLIHLHRPRRVINVGTAGGITLTSGIHRVNRIVQHDVNLMPLGLNPGEHPHDEKSVMVLDGEGVVCGSGDVFVTAPDKLRMHCDLVEMEAFSVAKAALATGIDCEIWKWISDSADDNSSSDWQERVSAGEPHYIEILEQLGVKAE
jgi:adenosylhomocysteine nucleosidase